MPDPDPLSAIKTPWASSATTPGVEAVPPLPVPDHALIRRIGRGAYGEVWLAKNALGVYRAVKIVHRRAFENDRPFERELAGMRRFEPVSRSHESQLNILHVGRGADCFFYVMELADDMGRGPAIDEATYAPRSLRSELLLRGRFPVEESVRLGLALTTALEHLHRHGLVHRDIKPSNIIFVNGIPKLADIGLVALAERTMSFVGTEGYLPPEGPGTAPADLFSLGKVLYEISTGQDRQQFPELPTNVMELPDRAALAEFNEVLVRACAPEVKQRYQTAAEMHADLALLQSGKSVAGLRALERKLRFVARAGAVVTAVAAVAAGLYFWEARQSRIVRELADQNRQIAEEKTRLAEEKSALAEANRERLARVDIANGVQLMDQENFAGALLWFADALPLLADQPAEAAIHRVRLNQLLARQPRLRHVLPHPASVLVAEFSPDERRVVTGCEDGTVRIWDLDRDEKPAAEFPLGGSIGGARFTRDGRRLLILQFNAAMRPDRFVVLDATSGTPVFAPFTNLVCAASSPDDRWLAVSRTNHVVQLIAAESGRVVAEAAGHEDRIEMISFSPDSKQFVTASRDRTARRWDATTGQALGPPLRHAQAVVHALFNRDATRIATATAAEGAGTAIQIQTWDTATGADLGAPIPGTDPCAVLAFDVSGRHLLTGDGSGTARVWNVDSHAAVLAPLRTDSKARSVDFAPDGVVAAIGSEGGSVWIWDAEDGNLKSPPLHHAGRVESLRFNQDGSRLLTAGDDGTVKEWELTPIPDDGRFAFDAFARSSAAFSRDGRQLLLGVQSFPFEIRLIDLDSLNTTLLPLPSSSAGPLTFLTIDRSGKQWAAAAGPPDVFGVILQSNAPTGNASLWRREGDQFRHFELAHRGAVRGVFFHEDGSQVLTVGDDRTARIWNTPDGSLRQTIPWPDQDGAWISVSPDLLTVVALFKDERGRHLVLREVQTGKPLGPLPGENPDINVASFSPDGRCVATAGDNQCGRIWDARTGLPLTPNFKHGGSLWCIDWSPDSRRVLTAGQSPEVKVWDAVTGEPVLRPLAVKAAAVEGGRFSTDGRFIVARSEDKCVRVWDAATGEAVTPLLPHPDNVLEAFVTAGQKLVTVSAQCVVRVWNLEESTLPGTELSDYARLLASGSLDHPESPPVGGPAEYAGLLCSLRARQPELFAESAGRLQEWHRRQAQDPKTLGRAEAAIFHLERLAQLAPTDAVTGQLRHCRSLLIPAREPATPPQLLDLTRAYTHSFELLQHGDFVELPRGRRKLAGVEFDLRGLIELDHRAEQSGRSGLHHPLAVVPVGQRCRTLHFLQATEGEPRVNGSTVARWRVHYVDGSAREWPVIYGEHVRDWWWWTSEEPLEANQATIVWRGRAAEWNLPGTDGVRLFMSTWTNPQPALEISRLEFRIGETSLKPFVVAITAR